MFLYLRVYLCVCICGVHETCRKMMGICLTPWTSTMWSCWGWIQKKKRWKMIEWRMVEGKKQGVGVGEGGEVEAQALKKFNTAPRGLSTMWQGWRNSESGRGGSRSRATECGWWKKCPCVLLHVLHYLPKKSW